MHRTQHAPDDPLTERQIRLIDEYLIDLNGMAAARRAGYATRGASRVACAILKQPNVKRELRKRMTARATRTRITADRVLKEYARIAFADIRRYTETGAGGMTVRSLESVSEDDSAAIAEMSVPGTKEGVTRIKLHDKKRALDAIARHLGLFDTKHAGDPKARNEEASRAREILAQRIALYAKRK
jgi:phage terminase small subunit